MSFLVFRSNMSNYLKVFYWGRVWYVGLVLWFILSVGFSGELRAKISNGGGPLVIGLKIMVSNHDGQTHKPKKKSRNTNTVCGYKNVH